MSQARGPAALARRVLPWVIGWMVFQLVVAIAGRAAARRKNEGDEGSARIRRVLTHSGIEMHPRNPALSDVHLDLAMAGGEIDLTGLPRPATAIDLTLHALMAGIAVRVPTDWTVWWQFRGVGGIGADGTVQRTHDEHAADLRVRARVVFGGVGIEGARSLRAQQRS